MLIDFVNNCSNDFITIIGEEAELGPSIEKVAISENTVWLTKLFLHHYHYMSQLFLRGVCPVLDC
jgi:hypothetical protein